VTSWQSTLQEAEKLFDQKELEQAEHLARQVLRSRPDCPRALQVLGLVCSERRQTQEAIDWLQQALARQPDLAPAHNGLGLCHFQFDDLDRALYHFNRALCIDPAYVHAHFNRALIWLKRGQYAEGWIEYEWRFPAGLVQRPKIPRPRWDGSPLNGRALVLHTEQGIGDVLQFIRLVPRLREQGGRIVLACQRPLHALLRTLPFIDDWFPIDQQATVNFDIYLPLLSLPGLLEITEENLPRKVPYVFAQPERVRRWEGRLAGLSGLKVGLCWQGSPTFRGDHNRSIPLEHYRALRQVPGLSLISLQKGPGEEQIPAQREGLALTVFDDLDTEAAFVDTAALMQHLDLVITSDTAMAHLAGALGRPVWVLLGVGADWRWLLERSDSPWYPTMRLFRQKAPGDWSGVFAEVVAELQRVVAGEASLPIGVTFTATEAPSPPPQESAMSETPPIAPAGSPPPQPLGELTSVHTSNFPELLRQLNISLAVTTYQAGRLIFLRPEGGVLNTHFRSFDRPMGLAYRNGHMAIGCGVQVWEFFNLPAVAPKVPPAGKHDACFLPRRTHFTGDIDIHEMAFAGDGTLWFINTRFCCLCNLDLHSSFVPRWRPPFITRLAPEDRCHLNGLALVDGQPRYATALAVADEPAGWRPNKVRGGVLMEVPSGQVLLEGLSMPHSPRWYRDRLWLQESGDGSLGWVDLDARKYHKVCELPGFTRGLDFVGPLAFVGLSQVRESAVFSGIPLGERLEERLCGVYVVNIESGEVVAYLHFTSGVQEVFAVQVLPGLQTPELVNEANDWLRHSYVVPDEALADVGPERAPEG
jgi:uncharacterized protein (TIGR03032 family)